MTYFDWIQAALWNRPVEGAAIDNEQLNLHLQQGTGPMVFPLMPMTTQMKSVCLYNMQQQIKIGHTLTTAWTALTQAGICPLLMKGASLAALYPDPQLRPSGDIDLFVGIDQYHPACAVMRETFPNALKFDEELDHYKHYNLIADGVSIEVHRVTVGFQHPLDERRYAKMEHFGKVHGEPLTVNGLEVMVFEPTFNALFVMLHSWEHMITRGANVRQLCDLALLLHHYHDRIDAKRLQCWLKQLHLMDVWQLYMYLLVRYIGIGQEETFFYTQAERLAVRAEHLMCDLLAGKMVEPKPQEKPSSNRIARKWHTMQGRLLNARRIAQYSPAYSRHMNATTLLHGALRFFAKDRHWE